MTAAMDVLVVGGGPAGTALAAACVDAGLDTALVDPAPRRAWPASYAAWADELPPGLPSGVVASRSARVRVVARTEHVIERPYVVLDNGALWRHLDRPGLTVHSGRMVGVEPSGAGSVVTLSDGRRYPAAVVVNAAGSAPPAAGSPVAAQTGYGVVLPADLLDHGAVDPGGSGANVVLMDWRQVDSHLSGASPLEGSLSHSSAIPSFCYAVPLGGGSVLLEETVLAARPPVPPEVLRVRLERRLAAAGIPPDAITRAERTGHAEQVVIPLDSPVPRRRRRRRVLPFGAAGGLIHPVTGYSIATVLSLAPRVAAALAGGLRRDPARAVRLAHRTMWPPPARLVHRLRRHGLRVLLRLPPPDVVDFFEVFCTVDQRHQTAYLSGRDDLVGTAAAMAAVFRASPWPTRRRLLGRP